MNSTARQNPFPGLRPFSTEEDYLFFGREEQTTELLGLLRQHRFLAVVGTSGSGKSSLVRAGLLPALHGGTMAQAGSAWEVLVLRPGGDPMTNLARAMVEADLYDAEDAESLPRLVATLNRSRLGLVEAARQSDLAAGTNLLVVVDQFEELFRFRQAGLTHQEAASAFVQLLLAAARDADQRIYVAITMRSDYLGECSHISGLAEAVNDGEYLIPRLTRAQRRAAIEKPVSVGGGTISHRLVQKLLNDVGDNADHLPVLQHALMRIFDYWAADHQDSEPLDLRHYERAGGLHEALSRHSDEVYDELPSDRLRTVAEKLFKSLTERGPDNRGIRRPTRLDRLCAIIDAQQEEVVAVVEAFRQAGRTFLMPMSDVELTAQTVIDISHESLMRVWKRLDRWVEEESQSARIYRRLADTAALYAEGKAGIYHDPDLQIALTWRETAHPTEAWAARYHPGFEQALAFLAKSSEVQRAEEQQLEAARQRELEQAKRLAETERLRATEQKRAAHRLKWLSGGVAVVAVLALVAFGVAFVARQEAQQLADNEAKAAADERIARRDAEDAKDREAKQRTQAEQARKDADDSRRRAEEALKSAEESFAKARSAVNAYLTAVSEDDQLKAPGLQPLRMQLLQSALQFYQQFLKERGDDPTLRRELAGVYYKVGEIYRELGKSAAARPAHAQARTLYQTLAAESPEDKDLQHGLAMAHYRLGSPAQALAILEKLIDPQDPRYHADLGYAYNDIAIKDAKTDKARELEFLRKALAVRERLVSLKPDDPEARLGLSASLNNIAIRLKESRNAEALALLQRAVEQCEVAYRLRPADALTARFLAIQLNNVASKAKKLGETELVVAAHRRRVEVFDRRARDNPTTPGFDTDLVTAYAKLLAEMQEAGRYAEATKLIDKARVRLAETTEETTEYFRQLLFFDLTVHGLAVLQAKSEPDAKAHVEQEAATAVRSLRQYILASFRDAQWMRTDPRTAPLRQQADFKELQARVDELEPAYITAYSYTATPEAKLAAREKILTALKALAGAPPMRRYVRRNLAQARQDLAQALLDAGRIAEARVAFDEALAARQQLVQEAPSNEQLRADLAQSQTAAGDLFASAGKLADAGKTWDKALDTVEEAFKSHPNSILYQTSLAQRLLHVADQYGKVALWDIADRHYRHAFEVQAPEDLLYWYLRATVMLERGDAAGYQTLTDRVLARLPTAKGIEVVHLARILLLSPDASVRHPDALKKAVQGVVSQEREWQAWCRGMAAIRLGQTEQALPLLASVKDPLQARAASALALRKLGRTEAARDALANADQFAEQRLRESLTLDNVKIPDAWWADWLAFRGVRREAHQAIHRKPMPDSPYDKLFRGRVLLALGETEKADAEFAAAVAMRDDIDVRLTRSRIYAKLGRKDDMLADLTRVQELKGDDPRTWVETGRMLAEHGEHARADAAFARASALGKGELNRFFDAGWWVVGPYPDLLDLACPPEFNPDPSKPVAAVGENRELQWQAVTTTPHTGNINVPHPMGGQSLASSYALTFVYADRDRTATLHFSPRDDARVWVNGRLVFGGFAPKIPGNSEIPVTLHKGRNTLLVKNRHNYSAPICECAFSDAPMRRGYALARFGLYAEAAEAFAQADQRAPLPASAAKLRVHTLLAAGRDEEAKRVFIEMVQRHDGQDRVDITTQLLEACLAAPEKSAERERWLAAARKFADNYRLANACLRAGKFEEAETKLRAETKKVQPYYLPLLASTLHHLGKADEARKTLEQAETRHAFLVKQALAATPYRPEQNWEQELWYQVTLREARILILGKKPGPSADETALLKNTLARLEELNKADDDYARLVAEIPTEPRLWIARGRRLGELKQWDEAAKAFAKATESSFKNVHVLKERGRAYADLGKWDEAAADFAVVADMTSTSTVGSGGYSWWTQRHGFDDAALRHTEVFDRLTKLRPKNVALLARKMNDLVTSGRYREAAAFQARAVELVPTNYEARQILALLHLAAGNHDEHRAVCQALLPSYLKATGFSIIEPMAAVTLLNPAVEVDKAIIEHWSVVTASSLFTGQLAHVLAEYRLGNYEKVIEQSAHFSKSMTHHAAGLRAVHAAALAKLGRHTEAAIVLQKAKEGLEHLPKAGRIEPPFRFNWWETLRATALIREAEKLMPATPVRVAQASLSAQEQAARSERKSRADRIATQAALAQIRIDVGQMKEAEAELRAVVAERAKIAAEEPTNPDYQTDLATAHQQLGQLLTTAGRSDEGAKEIQGAVAALEKLVAGEPKNARYQVDLAVNLFKLGDFHWKASQFADGRKAWQCASKHLDVVRGALANDAKLARIARSLELEAGRTYANLGLWTEATAYYRRAFETDALAGTATDRLNHALLLVLTGDEDGYRRFCSTLYERGGKKQTDLSFVRTMVLRPGALPDPKTVVSLAVDGRKATKSTSQSILHLALAQLRADQDKVALVSFQQFEKTKGGPPHLRLLAQALARHKAGKSDEAVSWLHKAEEEYAGMWLNYFAGGGTALPAQLQGWSLWAFYVSLRQETIVTITGKPAPADPWLHLQRGRAYSMLGQSDLADAEFQTAVKLLPNNTRILLGRSRVYAGLGKTAEAQADRDQAKQLAEAAVAKSPQDGAALTALAAVLLDRFEPKWIVVRPRAATSEGGATLTIRPDDSVLAGGVNPDRDVYIIEAEVPGRIEAIRLEAIPDPTMPQGSSGRGGNFILTDFRVTADGKDVKWNKAFADFSQENTAKSSHHPIAHAIDADPSTGWAVHPRVAEPHWAVFIPVDRLGGKEACRLTIRLAFQNKDWAKHTLGRFRLSVVRDVELDLAKTHVWFLAANTPRAKVGLAYLALDNPRQAADFLAKPVAVNENLDPVDWLALTLAHARLKEIDQARKACARAAELLRLKGADPTLRPLLREVVLVLGPDHAGIEELLKAASGAPPAALQNEIKQNPAAGYRARGNWFGERGRWQEAIADYTEAMRLEPDSLVAMKFGILLAHAGETDRYRAHCKEMLSRWGTTEKSDIAAQTLKTVLLLKDHKADAKQLERLAELSAAGDENQDGFAWRLFATALHEYRTGKHALARSTCGLSCRHAGASKGDVQALLALNSALEAMAFHALKVGDARKALANAGRLLGQHTLGIDGGDGWHAWLAAHILYREARLMVEGKQN